MWVNRNHNKISPLATPNIQAKIYFIRTSANGTAFLSPLRGGLSYHVHDWTVARPSRVSIEKVLGLEERDDTEVREPDLQETASALEQRQGLRSFALTGLLL